MIDVKLTVKLLLKGPILTRSSAPIEPGVDSPMARDSEGNYYFPFSLIRGRLRQSWEELADATGDDTYRGRIKELLGVVSGDASNPEVQGFDPLRGRLCFTDFVSNNATNHKSGRAYRVPIDPMRQSARKGGLLVIETPYAAGESVPFQGTIAFVASQKAEADEITRLITAGLRWITGLGAERTIGFGQLMGVEVEVQGTEVASFTQAHIGSSEPSDYLNIIIKPKASFCVAKPQPNKNLFVSDEILSGGVLRGAMATTIKHLLGMDSNEIKDNLPDPFVELGRYFNYLRFLHAFPALEGETKLRPVFPPLSLVDCYANVIKDVALFKEPFLIGSPPAAPSFKVDWKDDTFTKVFSQFGWGNPGRELRVRTKINPDTRRAENEKLFAYEMVKPKGYEWLARIDLTHITDLSARQKVITQLKTIFKYGLCSIGKTKVTAEIFDIGVMSPVYLSSIEPIDGYWIVTLQTPTLLGDPRNLNESSSGDDLHKAYFEAWSDISAGALELGWYFAGQSLAGGYLVRRYQPDKLYNPFLLTDAGSVFILKVASGKDGDARDSIRKWLANGLDLPGWAKQQYGTRWDECPFRREDGFGEIAVNLPCHTEKRPASEEVKNVLF